MIASPGRRYFVGGGAAVASPTKTLGILTGGTTIRVGIYDLYLGSSATPADNALLWKMQRSTAAGTSTAFTPIALDPADPAAVATAGTAASAEPTYTASAFLFWLALNQRATHRAILDPMAPMMIAATASAGIGLFTVHSTFTGNTDFTLFYYE